MPRWTHEETLRDMDAGYAEAEAEYAALRREHEAEDTCSACGGNTRNKRFCDECRIGCICTVGATSPSSLCYARATGHFRLAAPHNAPTSGWRSA